MTIQYTGDVVADFLAVLRSKQSEDLVAKVEQGFARANKRELDVVSTIWSQSVINMRLVEAMVASAAGDTAKRNAMLSDVTDMLKPQFEMATELVIRLIALDSPAELGETE